MGAKEPIEVTDEQITLKLRLEVEYEQLSVEEAIRWTMRDLNIPEERVREVAQKLFSLE